MTGASPLLAQSGHAELHCTCPLLGVKRTSQRHRKMSAYDPKQTLPIALPYWVHYVNVRN